jgi:hypothetical protein
MTSAHAESVSSIPSMSLHWCAWSSVQDTRGCRSTRRKSGGYRRPGHGEQFGGHCCFGEEYASITVDCDSSDGERELGERSREPMPRVNVGGQFVVAAANILDKGVAEADHPYGTDLFETAHRP